MFQQNQQFGGNQQFPGNNQNLPFSTTQPQFQMGNYNTVPNIGLEPYLQQFAQLVPAISSGLIQDIQSRAGSSPLRMFLFNQMARNGFNNPEFAQLVKTAVDYLGFLVRRGAQVNQQLLMKVVADMTAFCAAGNASQYPALWQMGDPNSIQGLQNAFAGIMNDIARERSGNFPGIQQQFGAGPMMGGGQFNQGMNMGPNFAGAVPGGVQRNYGSGPQNNTGLFTSGQPGSVDPTTSSNGMGRNYGSADTQFHPQPQQAQPHPFAQATQQAAQASENMVQDALGEAVESSDTYVDLKEANRDWVPGEGGYYRPAYEPSHQKIVAIRSNGRIFYQVKELENVNMDPARHRLTAAFGTTTSLVAEQLQTQKDRNAELAEAVSDAKVAQSGTDTTTDTYSRIVLDILPLELGYESAWVSGLVERIKRERENKDQNSKGINILQWQACVAEPIIVDSEDELNAILALSKMDSRALLQAMPAMKSRLTPATLSVLDERLTSATNHALVNNMGIDYVWMESFFDDWNDLITAIARKEGNTVAATFVSHDEDIIRIALNVMDAQSAASVTTGIYDTVDGETYPISYFSENVSFTIINFNSRELDIDFVKGTAALLSKVNTRTWYDLAEQIFREFGDCTRHLIRTIDGKIVEIRKGWLADNPYLINVVS